MRATYWYSHFRRNPSWFAKGKSVIRLSNAVGAFGVALTASTTAYGLYTVSSMQFSGCSPSKGASDVFTWGSNQYGQLGLGHEKDESLPKLTGFFRDHGLVPVSVSAAGSMSAVLTDDGTCFTFGFNYAANQTIPAPLTSQSGKMPPVSQVDVGGQHGAVLTHKGDIWTWGKGWQGQLGNGENESNNFPVQVPLENIHFKQVSCGFQHTAAVDIKGRLWTWGSGRDGALGLGDRQSVNQPNEVKGIENIKQVSCGNESTVLVTEDGTVYTFGSNDYGQLGLSTDGRYQVKPALVKALQNTKVIAVAAGDYHCACLTEDGRVYTWGMGKDGQTGHDDKVDITLPRLVSRLENVKITKIACGGGHTCAMSDDGQLWCWGRGRNGQIGRADNIESVAAYRATPQHIDSLQSLLATSVDCGGDHTIAIAQKV